MREDKRSLPETDSVAGCDSVERPRRSERFSQPVNSSAVRCGWCPKPWTDRSRGHSSTTSSERFAAAAMPVRSRSCLQLARWREVSAGTFVRPLRSRRAVHPRSRWVSRVSPESWDGDRNDRQPRRSSFSSRGNDSANPSTDVTRVMLRSRWRSPLRVSSGLTSETGRHRCRLSQVSRVSPLSGVRSSIPAQPFRSRERSSVRGASSERSDISLQRSTVSARSMTRCRRPVSEATRFSFNSVRPSSRKAGARREAAKPSGSWASGHSRTSVSEVSAATGANAAASSSAAPSSAITANSRTALRACGRFADPRSSE